MSKVKKVIIVLLFCTYIGFPIAFGIKTATRDVTLEYHQMYENLNTQAFVDFDKNGKMDVITTEYNGEESTEALAILSDVEDFNEEKKIFIENEDQFKFSDNFYTADFNGDENQDVFLVKDYYGIENEYRPNDYLIYEGNGYGSFPNYRRKLVNDSMVKNGNVLEAGDFNGDGLGDFLVNRDGNTTIGLQQDITDEYEFAWKNISYNVINAISINYNNDNADDLLIVHKENSNSETRVISILVSELHTTNSYQSSKAIEITGDLPADKQIVPAFLDYNGDSHKDVVFIRKEYQENTDFYVFTSNDAHTEFSEHLKTDISESIDLILAFPEEEDDQKSRIFTILYKIGYDPASGFLHNRGIAPNSWGMKQILYGLTWVFGGMILFSGSLNNLFDTLLFHKVADMGKIAIKNRRGNETIIPFLILLIGGPILALQGFVSRPDWVYDMFQFWGGSGGYIFFTISALIYGWFPFTPLKKFWDSLRSPLGGGKKIGSNSSKKLKNSSKSSPWTINSSSSSQPYDQDTSEINQGRDTYRPMDLNQNEISEAESNIGKATYRKDTGTYKKDSGNQNKQDLTYRKRDKKPLDRNQVKLFSENQPDKKDQDLLSSDSAPEIQNQELNLGKATFKKATPQKNTRRKKPKIFGGVNPKIDEVENEEIEEYEEESNTQNWFEDSEDEDGMNGW